MLSMKLLLLLYNNEGKWYVMMTLMMIWRYLNLTSKISGLEIIPVTKPSSVETCLMFSILIYITRTQKLLSITKKSKQIFVPTEIRIPSVVLLLLSDSISIAIYRCRNNLILFFCNLCMSSDIQFRYFSFFFWSFPFLVYYLWNSSISQREADGDQLPFYKSG